MLIDWFKYQRQQFTEAFSFKEYDLSKSEDQRRTALLTFIMFTGVIFLVPFGLYALYNCSYVQGLADLSAAIMITALEPYLRIKKKIEFVASIVVILFSILFVYLIISDEGSTSGHIWSLIAPVCVLFLIRGKKGLYYTLGFLATVMLIFALDIPEGRYDLYFKIRYAGAFSAILIIAYLLESARRKTLIAYKQKNKDLSTIVRELERKDAQLVESIGKYRVLFERSNDAIFLLDKLNIIDCNDKTLNIFGYTKEEILKMTPVELSPEYQPDGKLSREKIKDFFELARINGALRFEWLQKNKTGHEFYADTNLHIVEINKRQFIFVTLRDITSQKNTEQMLIKSKNEAEKSERLKSEFLAQVSHEIRTPVNAIVNLSSILKSDLENKLSQEDLIAFNAMEGSASRLVRTIDLILNMSEIEAGAYQPVFKDIDIASEIIEPLITVFSSLAEEKKLKLKFINELKNPFKIQMDHYTVSQSILNLIDNAIKYTNKGEVTVHLHSNGNVAVDVIDTGIGISKEYLNRMFAIFSQEDQGYSRRFEGNGLGLALVKEYCKINRAVIKVESKKGVGSKFSIIFSNTITSD
ncbi:MAG: PAS domain S-box protein [Melioribacteraceae bacterium]|nr:PAS domain S-box protein [Melioribacteraceae bacterium]